ncbi:hypothetical protein J2X31_001118 [Flavobacterium arsenatis]|uniref:Uncharacterized protein n=1 Tax=Flavobacterium arsenatis TaxID=1484332 RepID=A0ABU1TMB3_9FLAO|nr:hypothetical protein [Flavobacterium arsenatis]MDR6967111.1 hypothetical protein [Flavobacterium arsenatis]
MKRLTTIFFMFLTLQIAFAQEPESLIKQKIVDKSEVVIEKIGNRGLLSKTGNVYFVEDDLQTITAYGNQKKIWQINILKILGKPEVGKPFIRYLILSDTNLTVIYGKHSFAKLSLIDGSIISFGSD